MKIYENKTFSDEGKKMKRKVCELLEEKGSEIYTIDVGKNLKDATKMFIEMNIGALIVVNIKGEIQGIISERDIIRKLAKTDNAINEMSVEEVMTPHDKLVIGNPDDDIQYIMKVMTTNRIRHILIICSEGECKTEGLISIGDVIKALLTDLDYENKMLKDYIEGSYPV